MIIGVPREIMHDEARVAASPEAVAKYVADGFTVLFEKGAGEGAFYHDEEYKRQEPNLLMVLRRFTTVATSLLR